MVFATKQLRVETDQPEGLEQQIEVIAQSFEPDVTVRDRDRKLVAHHHHQKHGEHCGCGHDHGHEHHHDEHGEHCGCGHDHEHHHHDEDEELLQRSATVGGETRVYTIENLDCANCGAKIERRINAMEGVSDAVLIFATKQLRVTAPEHDGLAEKMVQTARVIEPDVQIIPPEIAKKRPKQQVGKYRCHSI